jgi:hypothetical protein
LNQLLDLDEILCGGDEIEDDLEAMFSNTIASVIRKWRMFKFVLWVQSNPLITFESIDMFGLSFVWR